ncbi:B12-binding domain-containing radical SAM protein [bacterium]|nr:B12-binding domain-containing radical SAM protein [bacterium]
MKVLFLYPGFASPAIECLSSFLKQHGHKTDVVYDPALFDDTMLGMKRVGKFFSYRKRILKFIEESDPDLIAFSVVTDLFEWSLSYARDIKKIKPDVPILFGGVHVSSVPEEVIKQDCVDYAAVGEGELTILDLCNTLENGGDPSKILNLWCKLNDEVVFNPVRPLIQNLDTLPFPDKDLFVRRANYTAKYLYWITTSRGCRNNCTFCSNNVLLNLYPERRKYLRRRSVDNVVEELIWAKKKYDYECIFFTDEIFSFNAKWLAELGEKMQKHLPGVRNFCQAHPSGFTEDICKALKETGCYSLELGVETINPKIRGEFLNRKDSNESIIRCIDLCHKYGIAVSVEHIFGIPTETEDDFLKTAYFYNEHPVERIQCYWLTFYPKLQIRTILEEKGLIPKITDPEKLSHEYCKPMILGGSSFNRRINKYLFLFAFYMYFPKWLRSIILKYKLYLLLPSWISFPHAFSKAFSKAHGIHVLQHYHKYPHFIFKKMLNLKTSEDAPAFSFKE